MSWLGFTHPWTLAGLAAIGLPVLIHFLTRPRPRRIAFPPFRFLVEACAGQQAVHRLRTIILLTIRTLAVAALVLVFAGPFVKPPGPAAGADAAKRVVIILDVSMSMRAVQHGVSLFTRAQAEAAELVRGLEAGSEAAVVLMGATPRPLLPALSRNLPALHDALVKAQPTHEVGDAVAAIALSQRLLGGAGTLCVLSDFQKSNWDAVKELPTGIQCRLRSVVSEPIENAAITALRVAPADPVAGESVEVVCTVFNCSPRPRQETVRLELGDFSGERRVELAAYGSANAGFNLTFSSPGVFAGRAALPADELHEDDIRHVAVTVLRGLTILLVSDADQADHRSAAFFVSRALVPSEQAVPGYTLVRRHSQDTDRGILEAADLYVVVAPAMLSGEAMEIIARRISQGARLLVAAVLILKEAGVGEVTRWRDRPSGMARSDEAGGQDPGMRGRHALGHVCLLLIPTQFFGTA